MQQKDGLSQNKRWLKALNPDYINIDDHSFEELVSLSVEFADLLNFYETDNKVYGTWKELLTADLTVILSYIITEDIKKYEVDFRTKEELIEQTGSNNKEVLFEYFKDIFESIISMAKLFNFWISRLRKFTDSESAFHDELEQAVKGLIKSYENLQSYSLGAERGDALGKSLQISFGKLASFRFAEEPVLDSSIYIGNNEGERIKNAVQHIKLIFDSFFDTLTYVKTIAPKYLEESLTRNNHHPQIGLLLAFLKLYKKAQNNLNSIKARHMDFYYRDVLLQTPKQAIPDRAHICFKLSDEVDSFSIEKGTRFLAGKDENGSMRLYETERDTHLNHATIQELRTLFVSKNKYVDVGSTEKLVSGIFESRINELKDDVDSNIWSLLGEDQTGISSTGRTMKDATIGFAIASPAFRLQEGERDIKIKITFRMETFEKFKESIKSISENTNSSFSEVFFRVFTHAFHISITSDMGWLLVKRYGVECPFIEQEEGNDASIIINFRLTSDDPALINMDSDLHGTEFFSKWPIARLLMNKDSFIYPYSLMSELILQEIEIKTEVSEVRNIIIYNNLGQVSIDEPFQPFGPMPKLGSYMLIGSKEVFEKRVKDVTLTLNWSDLPRNDGGLSDYYRAYEDYSINNTSFKIDFSVLKDGKWVYPKLAKDREYFLFESEDQETDGSPYLVSKLENSTTIGSLSLAEFKLSPIHSTSDEPLMYTNMAKNGFMKFELVGDEVMFGHKKYPFIISDIFLKNARIKKEKNKKEIPNEPYTPTLNSIRLGYTDTESIKFITKKGIKDETGIGEAFHIFPFQFNKKIYPSIDNDPVHLVPVLKETGCLYIGLANFNPPDSLTLFFNIKGKNVASYEDTSSDIRWHYLANNSWHALEDSQVLTDSTDKLLRSGIITLELPNRINKNNTILENSLHWIKVTGSKNIEMVGDAIEICTQATTAKWICESSSDTHLHRLLPPQTITNLENSIPAIISINQPNASFGGKLEETDKQFYIRNSERLRHKNRAIVSKDYEQLILDNFPGIFKVNCLQSTNSHKDIAPGEVLISVIPKTDTGSKLKEVPMANVSVLHEIKNFVQKHASPFVQIEVRNPNYERVRVVCAVRFKEGYNNGETIKRLNFDLKEFLSPWFYDSVREIRFGGEINISDVSGFIQSRFYVDFITKLSLLKVSEYDDHKYSLSDTARRYISKTQIDVVDSGEQIKASKPWSVLVSAKRHHIEILLEEEVIMAEQTGIDDLELGNSFIID